tara:strand:+ start:122 stop:556 length:435 start_codon:yes stop_codon:yes gene_type:complete
MTIITAGMGAIIKSLAKKKAAKKTKEIITRKSGEYIKSLGESKKRMYKDLGLTKKAEDLSQMKVSKETYRQYHGRSRGLHEEVKKRAGVSGDKSVLAEVKVMRKKYGLKGDQPHRYRTFRGKKVKGKHWEERADKVSEMMKKDK